MKITVKRLPSGYWHIRGLGPCNWAQPPSWPCSEEMLREHTFQQASEEFIRSSMSLGLTDKTRPYRLLVPEESPNDPE